MSNSNYLSYLKLLDVLHARKDISLLILNRVYGRRQFSTRLVCHHLDYELVCHWLTSAIIAQQVDIFNAWLVQQLPKSCRIVNLSRRLQCLDSLIRRNVSLIQFQAIWSLAVDNERRSISRAWVSRGLTSHSTLYRSFQGRFLQARWPNQQRQSTDGS